MRMCDVVFGTQVTCFSGNDQIIQDRVMGDNTGQEVIHPYHRYYCINVTDMSRSWTGQIFRVS